MSLTFIGGFVLASVPAGFMGINKGATGFGVIVMAFAGVSIFWSRA